MRVTAAQICVTAVGCVVLSFTHNHGDGGGGGGDGDVRQQRAPQRLIGAKIR